MLGLQEILSSPLPSGGDSSSMIGHGAENLEVRLQILSKGHDGGDVAAAVAVVGCRPDGDDFLRLEVVLVAFIYQLVGASNEL